MNLFFVNYVFCAAWPLAAVVPVVAAAPGRFAGWPNGRSLVPLWVPFAPFFS